MGAEGAGGATVVSLPSLERGGGLGDARARRKPRHVSTFRERILEERRLRKEARQRTTVSSFGTLNVRTYKSGERRYSFEIHRDAISQGWVS